MVKAKLGRSGREWYYATSGALCVSLNRDFVEEIAFAFYPRFSTLLTRLSLLSSLLPSILSLLSCPFLSFSPERTQRFCPPCDWIGDKRRTAALFREENQVKASVSRWFPSKDR